MTEPALALRDIAQSFDQGGNTIDVLNGVSLEVMPGQIIALVGPSGAGKTSLLQIAGLLDTPKRGEVNILKFTSLGLNDAQKTLIRRDNMGFVYQSHYLLKEFTARENIMLPQMLSGISTSQAGLRADFLLERMSLNHRSSHRPGRLSGGEQQRVAIGRALANNPKILIIDEPTGNLDPITASSVFEQLVELVKENNIAAIIATHNMDLADRMDKKLTLNQGQIFST
jgi:lipoprotein-releasing system ATP-binding protein